MGTVQRLLYPPRREARGKHVIPGLLVTESKRVPLRARRISWPVDGAPWRRKRTLGSRRRWFYFFLFLSSKFCLQYCLGGTFQGQETGVLPRWHIRAFSLVALDIHVTEVATKDENRIVGDARKNATTKIRVRWSRTEEKRFRVNKIRTNQYFLHGNTGNPKVVSKAKH